MLNKKRKVQKIAQ